MIDVACPECLLTPSGSRLLASVHDGLESTRPDDPTWQVERCESCGQARSIHDDLDGWTFGDLTPEREVDTPAILDLAPEWITVSEAAYGARVSEALILDWAETGRVERYALLPGKGTQGVLVRTADIRASMAAKDRTTDTAGALLPIEPPHEDVPDPQPPVSRWEVDRRKVLVGLGMAVSGALIPARAIAGGGPRLGAGATVLDPLAAAFRPPHTTDGKTSGGGKGGHGSGGHGGHGGGGGGGGGGTTAIQSVTVRPDPIAAGATATITIEASPRQRFVSYGMTASEGVLVQDPQSPWIWTWRAA